MFNGLMDMTPGIPFAKEWPDFRLYAIRKHSTDTYGEYPYAYHLAMVEAILLEYGYNEYVYQAAAWLHDVLEDTDTKLDHLNESYGPQVAALVYSVTGEGPNRKARNQSIYDKLKKHPEGAPLKVADRLANLTHSFNTMGYTGQMGKAQMYLDEQEEFKHNLMPMLIDSHRGRLLWEAVDTLVEKMKLGIEYIKETEALNKPLAITDEAKSGDEPSA